MAQLIKSWTGNQEGIGSNLGSCCVNVDFFIWFTAYGWIYLLIPESEHSLLYCVSHWVY